MVHYLVVQWPVPEYPVCILRHDHPGYHPSWHSLVRSFQNYSFQLVGTINRPTELNVYQPSLLAFISKQLVLGHFNSPQTIQFLFLSSHFKLTQGIFVYEGIDWRLAQSSFQLSHFPYVQDTTEWKILAGALW